MHVNGKSVGQNESYQSWRALIAYCEIDAHIGQSWHAEFPGRTATLDVNCCNLQNIP